MAVPFVLNQFSHSLTKGISMLWFLKLKFVAVSVEYRLAPEHSLPAAYQDCWATLQCVASHSFNNNNEEVKKDPWLLNHGDFDQLFIVGVSAGGNIVHNMAIQAGVEGLKGRVKILRCFLSHPYFLGSNSKPESSPDKSLPALIWKFVYPLAPVGVDNAMINPLGPEKPSQTGLGCSKLLVCVAERKDQLRDVGVPYYDAAKESGWKGEIKFFESRGEDHCFHIFNLDTKNIKLVLL